MHLRMSDGGLRNISLAYHHAEMMRWNLDPLPDTINITISIALQLHVKKICFLFIIMFNKVSLYYLLFIFEFFHYKPILLICQAHIYSMNFHIFYFSFLCINHLFCLFLWAKLHVLYHLLPQLLELFSLLINMIPIDTDWIFIFPLLPMTIFSSWFRLCTPLSTSFHFIFDNFVSTWFFYCYLSIPPCWYEDFLLWCPSSSFL